MYHRWPDEDYCGQVLEFRRLCKSLDINFKSGMTQAMRLFTMYHAAKGKPTRKRRRFSLDKHRV